MRHAPLNMPTADEALERLRAGNLRYVSARMSHPNQTPVRRGELLRGQHPFVVILGCADSRVPPEVIFDQGLGDLFVIRVAGNVIDPIVLGSIEYAAVHLHTPLIVVLGHSKCGAVAATASGAELGGHLPSIAAAIQPAINTARQMPGNLVDNAIRENARMVTRQLSSSTPLLAPLVNTGKLRVLPAHYDLASGSVEILPVPLG